MNNKVLIVCYSRSGTARQAARQLQQITGWGLAEVRDVRSRAGLLGDLRCLLDSLFARSAPYTFDGPSIESAERLVIVTPIWLDGLAAPMRAWLRGLKQTGRPVSLVCVMARGGAFRVADELTTIVGAAPAPVVALTQADVSSGTCRVALTSLAATIDALESEPVITRPIWLSPEAA